MSDLLNAVARQRREELGLDVLESRLAELERVVAALLTSDPRKRWPKLMAALAAATGTAKTAQQAPAESPQSGPKGNAQ